MSTAHLKIPSMWKRVGLTSHCLGKNYKSPTETDYFQSVNYDKHTLGSLFSALSTELSSPKCDL